MAEWTQERIAQRMNCVRDAGDIFYVDDRAEALAILTLAARGLAADQDAVKARALTREQAAIIGAYTGITCGPFSDIHGYVEKKLGRPVWTHEFARKDLMAEIKAAAAEDFLALVYQRDSDTTKYAVPSTDLKDAP